MQSCTQYRFLCSFSILCCHTSALAHAEAEGIKAAGGTADLYQILETLPDEILAKMHAGSRDTTVPTLESPKNLEEYDAFLFGIPTRYGSFPSQWRSFWDSTGSQWFQGAYWGKYAGLFVSTSGPGGRQESTAIAAMSTLAHHRIVYVRAVRVPRLFFQSSQT